MNSGEKIPRDENQDKIEYLRGEEITPSFLFFSSVPVFTRRGRSSSLAIIISGTMGEAVLTSDLHN